MAPMAELYVITSDMIPLSCISARSSSAFSGFMPFLHALMAALCPQVNRIYKIEPKSNAPKK